MANAAGMPVPARERDAQKMVRNAADRNLGYSIAV
jgi:hypothetical protein